MRQLFCDLSAVNQNAQNVSFRPMKQQVDATGSVNGNQVIKDSFESKPVLGREDNKQLFMTTQTGTAVNGKTATTSITGTRDASLVKKMKDDFCARFGQEKWDTACKQAGGEEALIKLIRGFSASIAQDKPTYSAWHNNNPSVTGTPDRDGNKSFSPQELSFNTNKGQAPQYCIPLDQAGNIQIEIITPPPVKEETPPIIENKQQTQTAPPPVRKMIDPGMMFSANPYPKPGATTLSFNLRKDSYDIGSRQYQMGNNSVQVTFAVDQGGKLNATVTRFEKDGQSTTATYTDTKDIQEVMGSFYKDGMLSEGNGTTLWNTLRTYEPGGFNNRDSQSYPIMAALYPICPGTGQY